MNKNLKKIIAREGLIFIGVTILSVFLGETAYQNFWTKIAPKINVVDLQYYSCRNLAGAIIWFIIAIYIIYLSVWFVYFLIRFIVWAIKTLKEK